MSNRFRIGYSLDQWLKMQRSNPNVFARVSIALGFFQKQFPHYSQERLLSELVCHDYSHPVVITELPVGLELVGYKPSGAPALAGSYFAPVGTPLHRVGVGYEALEGGVPQPKKFFRYRVTATVPAALKTICSPARDMWSRTDLPFGQLAGGGAVQYVIPTASSYLESLTDSK